jgi:PD-(D/E)XK nuclease superfamily
MGNVAPFARAGWIHETRRTRCSRSTRRNSRPAWPRRFDRPGDWFGHQHILPVHQAQLLTYLRLSICAVGFQLNFNTSLLKDGPPSFRQYVFSGTTAPSVIHAGRQRAGTVPMWLTAANNRGVKVPIGAWFGGCPPARLRPTSNVPLEPTKIKMRIAVREVSHAPGALPSRQLW